MNIPDKLHRNDIIHCVKHSSSKHVMIFNAQHEHDMNHHALRFCREFGMEAHYGVTSKDNCLLWVYDCAGAPNPHSYFETKSIYMFIDKLAKAFYNGKITDEMYG